jgi:hypothetical protein
MVKRLIIEVLSMEGKTCIKTMLLLWKWWSVRNKINKGEKGMSGDEVAAAVLQLMGDPGVNEKQAPVSQGALSARWRAPPQDQLKINADSSLIPQTLQGSWGILAGAGRQHAVPYALHCRGCGMLAGFADGYKLWNLSHSVGDGLLCSKTSSPLIFNGFGGMWDFRYSFLANSALCM